MNTWLNRLIETLNATRLSGFVMDSAYVFPFLEMVHFVGLCLLLGALIVVDLRVAGLVRAVPIRRVGIFVRFAVLGFALNLLSGLLFVVGDPDRYLVNIAFRAKMVLILLAGLNTVWFGLRIKPRMEAALEPAQFRDARVVAWLSLALWTGVIVLGRFIPYVEDL